MSTLKVFIDDQFKDREEILVNSVKSLLRRTQYLTVRSLDLLCVKNDEINQFFFRQKIL